MWRRVNARMFRSKLKSKIEHPEDCSEIGYQVNRGCPLLRLGVWIIFFFSYVVAVRSVAIWRGFTCDFNKETGPSSDENIMDSLILWTGAVLGVAAAFLVGQGYCRLRAARERMERVRQTAVTLACAFLKEARVPRGDHSHGELPIVVYECLALLTVYPVTLLHQVRGNTWEPAVTKYCQQVAYNLRELRDGARIIIRSPDATRQAIAGHRGSPIQQPVRLEYFFELFSLHLESEFSQQYRKSPVPSMAPQHVVYQLRNHFLNMVDNHFLDPNCAPIVRENIDMMALGGRECTIYAGCDIVPVCTLWAVDICCRLIALSVPLRRCSWLITAHGVDLFVWLAFLAMTSAACMMILAEMWAMWDPFGRGMNTFSWTLGIASEIDNVLHEFYESETRVPLREHKFMDPSDDDYSSSSGSYLTTTPTTTRSGREVTLDSTRSSRGVTLDSTMSK